MILLTALVWGRRQAAPAREGPTVQRRGQWGLGKRTMVPLEHAIVRWWLAPPRDNVYS
jgi:uncharacterized membrane protein YfbV (UPF0208 family)